MRRWLCVAVLPFVFAAVPSAQKRIGTFDRQAIVVAFYRSPRWADTLKAKRSARDEAERANDLARVEALNRWGEESQTLAHRQLLGDAPIANILEALTPAFDQIGRAANLDEIVPAPSTARVVEAVDVTDLLLDWLKADETTRRFIKELQDKRNR